MVNTAAVAIAVSQVQAGHGGPYDGTWYERRYRWVPIGCSMFWALHGMRGGGVQLVQVRELHVFGVRIARWIVSLTPMPRPGGVWSPEPEPDTALAGDPGEP